MKDDKNNNVIVPIILDGSGTWAGVRIAANIVASAYGKENIKSMITSAIMDDRVLYVDKKRSDAFAQNVGIQYPKRLRNGGFIHIIRQNDNDVNNNAPNSKRFSPRTASEVEQMTPKQIDEGYMAAMRAGADEGQLMTYVDEIARRRGYLSGNFMHGTNDFGFRFHEDKKQSDYNQNTYRHLYKVNAKAVLKIGLLSDMNSIFKCPIENRPLWDIVETYIMLHCDFLL